MSRQFFIVEFRDQDAKDGWMPGWETQLAKQLGVSERQIIVVEGAHVHVVDVKEPGEDRSK